MTVKRKKKSTLMGGRAVTVAFSLCLLAVVAMIGMYTVGKSEQKEKELKQEIVKAEQKQAGAGKTGKRTGGKSGGGAAGCGIGCGTATKGDQRERRQQGGC